MSKFIPAGDGGSNTYDLGAAFKSAITGSRLTGYTGEISSELAHKHGDSGLRIPLQAVMGQKATGSSFAVPGAVPLNGYDISSSITELDGAVKKELLAGKFGVTTLTTSEAEYRLPRVDTRPTAVITDMDLPLPDGGGTSADFISIKPVMGGTMIEIANSLDFSRPDVVQLLTRMVTDVVVEAIDDAFLNGYGPLASGLTFAGLAASATPSTVPTLNNLSTISQWANVVEDYSAYVQSTDVSRGKWLVHPLVANSLLPTSPTFTGALMAIGQTGGVGTLLGHEVITGRLPVVAGAPRTTDIYFGQPEEVHLVFFESGSLSLTVNPYADSVFSKGASLVRVGIAFGMAIRDPKRIIKAGAQLP